MRSLLPWALVFMPFGLAAQPVLLYTSMPTAPYVLDWYMVTDPGTAVLPADGTDQTWDLTSITLQYMGTATLVDASTTPYAAQFPAANWAFDHQLSGTSTHFYNYSQVDATGVQTWGNEVPINTEAYIDPKYIVAFPFNYGDSLFDNYQVQGGPLQPVIRGYTGYGTALTPLGSFIGLVKVSSSEGSMELYSSDPFFPVVLINPDGGMFLFAPHTTGIAPPAAAEPLTIAPGSTQGPLHVMLPTDHNASSWRILDATGRLVGTGPVQSSTTLQLDAGNLGPGLYRLVVFGQQRQWMGSFVRE